MQLKKDDVVYLSLDGREKDKRYTVAFVLRGRVWLRDSWGVWGPCDISAATQIISAPLTPFTPQPRVKGRGGRR
jgi:hypothetical protein